MLILRILGALLIISGGASATVYIRDQGQAVVAFRLADCQILTCYHIDIYSFTSLGATGDRCIKR